VRVVGFICSVCGIRAAFVQTGIGRKTAVYNRTQACHIVCLVDAFGAKLGRKRNAI